MTTTNHYITRTSHHDNAVTLQALAVQLLLSPRWFSMTVPWPKITQIHNVGQQWIGDSCNSVPAVCGCWWFNA